MVAVIGLVLVVLECTRRVIGWALPITALVFIGYTVFFTDVSVMVLVDQLYMTTEGIFGSTLGVSAAYVMIFVLFGAFMERTGRSEEHTSELQSLMRISYAVFCLKKKKKKTQHNSSRVKAL